MKRPIVRPLAAVAMISLASLALGTLPSSAVAQDRVPVSFDPGATSTTINGAIIGAEYIDYVLGAREGQTMVVSLAATGTNGNGTIYFNIVPAGQDFPALYNGSMDGNRAEVVLPESRDWAIRVYLMGNDRDTGKTVGFSIDVYIAPGGSQDASAPGSGAALLPEEDFFVVRLSGGGVLNVRDGPGGNAQKIGEHRDGTVLRNMGGCTISDGDQWCQVQASGGGVIGWVAARFLGLPGPGDQSGAAPGGEMMRVAGVPSNDVLNVRSGPGTGNGIVGALANGDTVRMLGCQDTGGARWCEIEMQTDMRERGWVNARYLAQDGATATQLPSASRMERVRFAAGATGTEFTDQLGPGSSVTYLLGAQNGQMLYFRLAANGPNLDWRLYNPDGSLLDQGGPAKEYRGQLWQSGDHKIEVFNRGGGAQSFNVILGIQ